MDGQQPAASQGIASSGCGFDIPCICTNGDFLVSLQNTIAQACDPDAQKSIFSSPSIILLPYTASDTAIIATLAAAKTLCTTAIPALNDSRQPEILASLIVMMVLSVLAVVLRLVSRRISAAKFGIDDALIIIALVRPPAYRG